MRTYNTPDNPMYNAVEMEWLVGPIPIEKGGKEVVMEYSTAGTCFSGIYRDKTMADELMYIPNDDTQNYPICRLLLMVETFGFSTKFV